MPHLVMEYSEQDFDDATIGVAISAAHKGALDSGLFAESDIKVRAFPCRHGLVAGKPQSFLHTTVYLLSGRDAETKKKLAMLLLDHMKNAGLTAASLSVDCRDMDRAVYSKVTG